MLRQKPEKFTQFDDKESFTNGWIFSVSIFQLLIVFMYSMSQITYYSAVTDVSESLVLEKMSDASLSKHFKIVNDSQYLTVW